MDVGHLNFSFSACVFDILRSPLSYAVDSLQPHVVVVVFFSFTWVRAVS